MPTGPLVKERRRNGIWKEEDDDEEEEKEVYACLCAGASNESELLNGC
jgi:hypothetical protein